SYAIGAPADLDGDGEPEIPYVKNDEIRLADAAGADGTFTTDPGATAGMATRDVAGDATPEVVYYDDDDERLRVAYANGTTVPWVDEWGHYLRSDEDGAA
ncbi:MAG: hypothetical protein V5A33_06985, partial [Halobacteriales archaeon]